MAEVGKAACNYTVVSELGLEFLRVKDLDAGKDGGRA